MAGVKPLGDFCRIEFPAKARPATTRVVLAVRVEERVVTTDTMVSSGFGMITILATEWRLGAGLPGYPVLFSIQLGPPLVGSFDDFLHDGTYSKRQTWQEPFERLQQPILL